MSRRALLAVAVAVSCATLAGCGDPKYDEVVDRIAEAGSPLIAEVVHLEPNLGARIERLVVYLVPDVTDEQVIEAWCGVIVPAGIEQLPDDRTSMWAAGTNDPENLSWGATPLDKPLCPSPLAS